MQTVNWGMIGCGEVTETKTGPGLYLARDSQLVGITSRTLSRAQAWVDRHGHGRVYENAATLARDPEIDILYVATTPDSHKQYALLAAESGKHCYLEKPIAMNMREAAEIQEAFRKSRTRCFVAHYRRGMGRFKRIRELLLAGEIGRVRCIRIFRSQRAVLPDPKTGKRNWKYDPAYSGGGIFFEGDVHLIDLMDFLVGPLTCWQVCADRLTDAYPAEDLASIILRGQEGVLISGLWDYAAWKPQDEVEICGDKGLIRFHYADNSSPTILENESGTREICVPEERYVGAPQVQDIVDDLLGRGNCSSTLDTAMRTMEICCGMWQSYLNQNS
ncbi:Gfo/Idh/MocA family protein [Anaerotruncus rubiinfantis]|uniref:Gfo/Idh/MocA family protein n=1 Tax=Anaerotruncus rubiinfantis TaxID=1720200 RepID=UPI0018972CBF|nr:Gfo/Idh/MocA family oxidoreductase [Anaerotruncus rubiinfantis]